MTGGAWGLPLGMASARVLEVSRPISTEAVLPCNPRLLSLFTEISTVFAVPSIPLDAVSGSFRNTESTLRAREWLVGTITGVNVDGGANLDGGTNVDGGVEADLGRDFVGLNNKVGPSPSFIGV